MTLLAQLGSQLPQRYCLGIDVGYKKHVAVIISLQTFARGDDRWKRARCLYFPSTRAGLDRLQGYLDGFCPDPEAFLGLCEPTGGFYGARCSNTWPPAGLEKPRMNRQPRKTGDLAN